MRPKGRGPNFLAEAAGFNSILMRVGGLRSFVINYNPTLSASRLWYLPVKVPLLIDGLSINGNTVGLTTATEVGKRYGVHWSPDLASDSWSLVDA